MIAVKAELFGTQQHEWGKNYAGNQKRSFRFSNVGLAVWAVSYRRSPSIVHRADVCDLANPDAGASTIGDGVDLYSQPIRAYLRSLVS